MKKQRKKKDCRRIKVFYILKYTYIFQKVNSKFLNVLNHKKAEPIGSAAVFISG